MGWLVPDPVTSRVNTGTSTWQTVRCLRHFRPETSAFVMTLALFAACSSSGPPDGASMDLSVADGALAGDLAISDARGFPAVAPWVSYYGAAAGIDLAKAAATFRVINIDAD